MNTHDTLIALRRIMRAIDLHSKSLERTAGLTVPQLLVLQALKGPEGCSVGSIAQEVNLSQGTVTAIIDRLELKHLVARQRSQEDRRRVRVTLTAAGEAKIREAPAMLQEGFVSRFEALPSWEQKMLAASLERIAQLLYAQNVDAAPILDSGEIISDSGRKPDT